MLITQKNQYALRAIFELAKQKHQGNFPVKIAAIARAQEIPVRFLEVILSHLKGSGIVTSKRGHYGGYSLALHPAQITVGDIMRHMEGEASRAFCVSCVTRRDCKFQGDCPFLALWQQVNQAIFAIYDRTTIQDLLDNA